MIMSPTTGLLLALVLSVATAMPPRSDQIVGDLQLEENQQPPPTDIAQRKSSRSHLGDAFLLSNEVDDRAEHEYERNQNPLTMQHGVRARRDAERTSKRFGFSFGTAISPFNEAKKREVASLKTTTTTKRPFPFWKQRTSTTKRPTTKPAASTTKRTFPRWKSSTTTEKPAAVPTTRKTAFKWARTTASTARTTPTTKRPFFGRKQTTTTTTKRPSTTTKHSVPGWLQRTATTERPSTTNKWQKTTRRTTTKPKTARQTTSKRPAARTTTKRPAPRRLFTQPPTTTKRTTTKRSTTTTTTKRPATAKRPATTTKRPTARQATTKRPATRQVTTKRPTVAAKRLAPTTNRPALFSPRGAGRAQAAHRPAFHFGRRPSPSSARTTPRPTSRPKTDALPKEADPLTSLLMQIASLSPRRTVGSPSVLLAIAALATPATAGRPAVRLDPKQEGFRLSLKHPPEGACAPCLPTFLVDLEKCHPCVIIR